MCSVTGRHTHSVALDEAHEMLINKDLKTTIVRPTRSYALIQKAVKSEVMLNVDHSQRDKVGVFSDSPQSVKNEESMMTKIQTSLSSGEPGRCLTAVSGQVATPEQQTDLLGFWEVGKVRLENQIKFFILREPSTPAPRRKAKLLTFASTRKQAKKMKRLDKEKKIVGKCLRRAFAWNVKHGTGM